jgi:flagellar transcriptional activator FlhD
MEKAQTPCNAKQETNLQSVFKQIRYRLDGFSQAAVQSDSYENAAPPNAVAREISELNLSYLLLAQRLLLQDYESACFRLGLGPQMADALLALSAAETIRLAGCGSLVCVARFDDAALLNRLARDEAEGALHRVRSVILLASQPRAGG